MLLSVSVIFLYFLLSRSLSLFRKKTTFQVVFYKVVFKVPTDYLSVKDWAALSMDFMLIEMLNLNFAVLVSAVPRLGWTLGTKKSWHSTSHWKYWVSEVSGAVAISERPLSLDYSRAVTPLVPRKFVLICLLCFVFFHLVSTLHIQLTLKLSLRLILESTPNFVSTLFCRCTQGLRPDRNVSKNSAWTGPVHPIFAHITFDHRCSTERTKCKTCQNVHIKLDLVAVIFSGNAVLTS